MFGLLTQLTPPLCVRSYLLAFLSCLHLLRPSTCPGCLSLINNIRISLFLLLIFWYPYLTLAIQHWLTILEYYLHSFLNVNLHRSLFYPLYSHHWLIYYSRYDAANLLHSAKHLVLIITYVCFYYYFAIFTKAKKFSIETHLIQHTLWSCLFNLVN